MIVAEFVEFLDWECDGGFGGHGEDVDDLKCV